MSAFNEELFEFAGILERDCERNLDLLSENLGLNVKIDLEALKSGLEEEDAQYLARQYIRSLFSFLEAFIHALKITALEGCKKNGVAFSEFEKDIVLNQKREINNDGEAYTKRNYISTDKNVQFSFNFFSRAYSVPNPLKVEEIRNGKPQKVASNLWSDYANLKNIRNRVTHPTNLKEVNVEVKDLLDSIRFQSNFRDELIAIMIELEIARPLLELPELKVLNKQLQKLSDKT